MICTFLLRAVHRPAFRKWADQRRGQIDIDDGSRQVKGCNSIFLSARGAQMAICQRVVICPACNLNRELQTGESQSACAITLSLRTRRSGIANRVYCLAENKTGN
jgi:hypothetical protein